jgi:hypothetical protein
MGTTATVESGGYIKVQLNFGPVFDRREQAAPWQPSNSAFSGSDRHDFAVSQGLEIAIECQTEETGSIEPVHRKSLSTKPSYKVEFDTG